MICRAMCQAVRDLASLYCTLPPAVRSKELAVPQLAMLYYNDCQYLSDELLLLPQLYTNSASKLLGGRGVEFVNEACRLRSAGKQVLENQVSYCHMRFELIQLCTCATGMVPIRIVRLEHVKWTLLCGCSAILVIKPSENAPSIVISPLLLSDFGTLIDLGLMVLCVQ